MRIIFAGTPAFAAEALKALIDSQHEVVLVLSQPDRPAGRGRKLKASEVKEVALNAGLTVLTPLTLRSAKGLEETQAALQAMREAQADVLVVAAYGLILPQEVLDIPKGVLPERYPTLKAVNIHASLLPDWRGAAPIARAIEAGDRETGVTIMQMEAGLDTGPMLYKKAVPIRVGETAEALTEDLAKLGAEMVVTYLDDPQAYPPVAQPEHASYAAKLNKEEGKIDWTLPADKLANKICAFNPFPGSFFTCGDDVLKAWGAQPTATKTTEEPGTVIQADKNGVDVACGEGTVIRMTLLQRAGGKKLPAREFLSGYNIAVGEVLK